MVRRALDCASSRIKVAGALLLLSSAESRCRAQ